MARISPDGLLPCSKHPDHAAVLTCVECGAGICQQCLIEIPDSYRLLCPACNLKKIKKKIVFTGFKTLKSPVLWVVLCVLISAVAYAMGVGNPRLETMKKRDQKWNWYAQDVGKMYLSKATRENQRAAALVILGRPDEAVKWYARAAIAFELAADYWKATPVYEYLRAATASAYIQTGKSDKALEILDSIKLKHGDPSAVGVAFMQGRAHEKLGHNDKAKQAFKLALEKRDDSISRKMDDFIDVMTGDRREAKMIFSIRELCGLNISLDLLSAKLDKYGIENDNSPLPFVKCPPALKKKLEEFKLELKKKPAPKPEKKVDDTLIIEKLDEKTGQTVKPVQSVETVQVNKTVTAEMPEVSRETSGVNNKKAETDELKIEILDGGK